MGLKPTTPWKSFYCYRRINSWLQSLPFSKKDYIPWGVGLGIATTCRHLGYLDMPIPGGHIICGKSYEVRAELLTAIWLLGGIIKFLVSRLHFRNSEALVFLFTYTRSTQAYRNIHPHPIGCVNKPFGSSVPRGVFMLSSRPNFPVR